MRTKHIDTISISLQIGELEEVNEVNTPTTAKNTTAIQITKYILAGLACPY